MALETQTHGRGSKWEKEEGLPVLILIQGRPDSQPQRPWFGGSGPPGDAALHRFTLFPVLLVSVQGSPQCVGFSGLKGRLGVAVILHQVWLRQRRRIRKAKSTFFHAGALIWGKEF